MYSYRYVDSVEFTIFKKVKHLVNKRLTRSSDLPYYFFSDSHHCISDTLPVLEGFLHSQEGQKSFTPLFQYLSKFQLFNL